MLEKKQRKSPEQSATKYKLGTKKTGLDGNTWIIAENKNNIKRWVLFKVKQNKQSTKSSSSKTNKKSSSSKSNNKSSSSKTKIKKRADSKTNKKSTAKTPAKKTSKDSLKKTKSSSNDGKNNLQTIIYDRRTKKLERYYRGKWYRVTAKNLQDIKLSQENYNNFSWPKSFNLYDISHFLQQEEKIIKVGKLNITSGKIGIGELLYDEAPIKKGIYNVYGYSGSLIVLPEDRDISGETFKRTNINVGCDIGMFSFNDAVRVKKLLEREKPRKKTVFGISFHELDTIIFTDKNRRIKPTVDAYYVYESDIDRDLDRKNPIAIFAGNRYGDGGFSVYKSKHGYMILSVNVERRLVVYGAIKEKIKV